MAGRPSRTYIQQFSAYTGCSPDDDVVVWMVSTHPLYLFYNYYLLFHRFSHQRLLVVFNWSLSDSESPLVTRTLLSILADPNNAVLWIVSTRPFISESSTFFINPLVTVPWPPIIIGINATFTCHSFFQFPSKVLILLSGQPGQQIQQFCKFYFFVDYYKVWPRLSDAFGCQNPRRVFVCHSPGLMLSCAYTIFSYGQIEIPCTSLSGSPYLPCWVWS